MVNDRWVNGGCESHTRDYVQLAVFSATTPAMQLMLTQLALGLSVTSSVDDNMVGESFRPMCAYPEISPV